MTMMEYDTLADALRDGWELPSPSDPPEHTTTPPGDGWQAPVPHGRQHPDGRTAETVYVRQARNKGGARGAFYDLYRRAE